MERRMERRADKKKPTTHFQPIFNGSIEWPANLYEYISSQHGMDTSPLLSSLTSQLVYCVHGSVLFFVADLSVFVSLLSYGYCLLRTLLIAKIHRAYTFYTLCMVYIQSADHRTKASELQSRIFSGQFLGLFVNRIESRFFGRIL